MKKITKFIMSVFIIILSLQPSFAGDQVTCETHANNYLFERSGDTVSTVKSLVINRCNSSLLVSDKYDCTKNIKCFDNNISSELILCQTRSNNQTFKAENTMLAKSQASVLKQCFANPYTSRNECYDFLKCND